ncbi:glucose 1-dehydrogenase [Dyella sp.]|uniref:SDR family NAD(P)-dependent oxidoreductase n=1 Tax=Dyella sp. TaxID=1869338 RepID=UPI002ED1E7AD
MKRFLDKTVVITGGSEGIGLSTAKQFASEGACVYVTGRRKEALENAERQIGHGAIGLQGDVGNIEDLDRIFARVGHERGKIDIVFANAGISESATIGEIDEAHFERLFTTNVKGVVFTVQKALPLMGDGSTIVLTSSAAGSKGFGGLSIYSATKAAIRSLARTWTTDLKHRGIRVNVVSPGVIMTPALQAYIERNEGAEEALKQMTPFGRIGKPEEVADAVLFLASDESSFIAGDELFVDGGFKAV